MEDIRKIKEENKNNKNEKENKNMKKNTIVKGMGMRTEREAYWAIAILGNKESKPQYAFTKMVNDYLAKRNENEETKVEEKEEEVKVAAAVAKKGIVTKVIDFVKSTADKIVKGIKGFFKKVTGLFHK